MKKEMSGSPLRKNFRKKETALKRQFQNTILTAECPAAALSGAVLQI
jgi:hypothetical protein